MTLGEKIKKARKEKHMTQSQLCGDRITRNMLSQIETGHANPSLETINYIAKTLGLSCGYLLSDIGEDDYRKLENIQKIKKLFAEKKYESCIILCTKMNLTYDDEIKLILAECYFHCGETELNNGYPNKAVEMFRHAAEYAENTIYPTSSLMSKITLISAIAENMQSPRLELDDELYLKYREESSYSEIYHYLIDDTKYDYKDEILSDIAKSRLKMKSGDYTEAAKILSALDDAKGIKSIRSYILFRIYSDLEICYRELRDFELAYKYSTKRIALISAFGL
ncbi:MAG: helix-turn-helix transcriptional regulator [Eubacteriales bacterium]|nr:helix-turn-helix transcriptional regulator [Eubacteriales bacterium]